MVLMLLTSYYTIKVGYDTWTWLQYTNNIKIKWYWYPFTLTTTFNSFHDEGHLLMQREISSHIRLSDELFVMHKSSCKDHEKNHCMTKFWTSSCKKGSHNEIMLGRTKFIWPKSFVARIKVQTLFIAMYNLGRDVSVCKNIARWKYLVQ